MLEILLTLVVLLPVLLARKGRKGRYRPYLRGRIHHKLGLGTLAAITLVGGTDVETLSEPAFLSSIKAVWSLDDFTPAAGVGPIMVGVAHSDYTDAEVEEWAELVTSWSRGDQISQEKNRRKIRQVGVFHSTGITSPNAIMVLNDGKPITTKCKWMVFSGQTIRYWAYNMGENSLATTAPDVNIEGHANFWPRS